jgi:hypothetical protein
MVVIYCFCCFSIYGYILDTIPQVFLCIANNSQWLVLPLKLWPHRKWIILYNNMKELWFPQVLFFVVTDLLYKLFCYFFPKYRLVLVEENLERARRVQLSGIAYKMILMIDDRLNQHQILNILNTFFHKKILTSASWLIIHRNLYQCSITLNYVSIMYIYIYIHLFLYMYVYINKYVHNIGRSHMLFSFLLSC